MDLIPKKSPITTPSFSFFSSFHQRMSDFVFCRLHTGTVRAGGHLHGVISTVSVPRGVFTQHNVHQQQPLDSTSFFIPHSLWVQAKDDPAIIQSATDGDPDTAPDAAPPGSAAAPAAAAAAAQESPVTTSASGKVVQGGLVARTLKLRIVGTERASWSEIITKDLNGDEDFFGDKVVFDETVTLWAAKSPSRHIISPIPAAAAFVSPPVPAGTAEAPNGAGNDTGFALGSEVPSLLSPKSSQDFVVGNILAFGTHSFGFSVKLPERVPASYEIPDKLRRGDHDWKIPGRIGLPITLNVDTKIEYTATAFIELKDKNEAGEYLKLSAPAQTFRILENVAESVVEQGPVTESASKTFLFGGKNPLHLKVFLPRSVWFSNEAIPLVAEVRNLSSKRVDFLSMTLKRVTTLKGVSKGNSANPSRTQEIEDIVVHQKVPNTSVEPHDSRNFDLIFLFPETPRISTVSLADNIKVRFELKVEVHITQAFNIDVVFPITVVSRLDKDTHLTECVLPSTTSSPTASSQTPQTPSAPTQQASQPPPQQTPIASPALSPLKGLVRTVSNLSQRDAPSQTNSSSSISSSKSTEAKGGFLGGLPSPFGKKAPQPTVSTAAPLRPPSFSELESSEEPLSPRSNLGDDVVIANAAIEDQFDPSQDSLGDASDDVAAELPVEHHETDIRVGKKLEGYETVDL